MVGEEGKIYSRRQFMCFTTFNWENCFLNFLPGNMTLGLYGYLHCFNDWGMLIPSRKKEEVYVAGAVTSKLLGTQCRLLFPGLWLCDRCTYCILICARCNLYNNKPVLFFFLYKVAYYLVFWTWKIKKPVR